MKKLTIFWIMLFTFQIFTQEKNPALKFDEFSNYPGEKLSSFYERIERFGARMKREPKSKRAIIIYYNQRKGKFPLQAGEHWAEEVNRVLKSYNYKIPQERIVLINGGYREYPTLEFWIDPQGVALPTPNPYFSKDEIIYCPDINLAGDGFRKDKKNPLKFSVVLQGLEKNETFPLEWSISAGKIIKGQGTNLIETDINEIKGSKITASVIVKGLPPECNAHQFLTTEVGLYPHKIDEFSYLPYSDIANRMSNGLAVELAEDPTATGYIVIYGSRDGRLKAVTITINSIRQTIDFMRLDRSRITIIEGGVREEMMVEVYLVPAGAKPPTPTPTLNADFVVPPPKIIKKRKKTK